MKFGVSALRRRLLEMPLEQTWAYAVTQDAVYRAQKGTDPIGASCSKGKCEKCIFYGCEHECHKEQIFIDPITSDGKWKGIKKFAWITPEQSSNNKKIP